MKESSDKQNPKKLEDLFRLSLEEAEVTPSDRVWERISQNLDSKEAGYYKERLGWYRSLAAACIFLVMCAAGYLVYDINYSHNTQNTVAQQITAPATLPAAINSNPSVSEPTAKLPNAKSPLAEPNNQNLPATPPLAQANIKGKAPIKGLPEGRAISRAGLTAADRNLVSAAPEPTPHKNNESISNQQNQTELISSVGVPGSEGASELPGSGNVIEPLVSETIGLPTYLSKVAVQPEMRPMPPVTKSVPNALAMLTETPTNKTEKAKSGRWSFSAKYAPQYFNQNIQLAAQSSGTAVNAPAFSAAPSSNFAASTTSYTQALNEYDNTTTPGFSFNSGVAAGYVLNDHWALESGLNFTQNIANSSTSFIFNNTNLAARYNFAPQNLNNTDSKQNDPISVLPATALLATLSGQENFNAATVVQTPTFNTQYRYRLLGIPVRLSYQTSQRKSFYFASVGFLTNMLVQAHVLSSSAKVPDIKFQGQAESPFRTWQVAATVSAGRGFQISRSINVRAGLEGTQNLNSLAANPENLSNGNGKPYTIGVAFSSSYTIGR